MIIGAGDADGDKGNYLCANLSEIPGTDRVSTPKLELQPETGTITEGAACTKARPRASQETCTAHHGATPPRTPRT